VWLAVGAVTIAMLRLIRSERHSGCVSYENPKNGQSGAAQFAANVIFVRLRRRR